MFTQKFIKIFHSVQEIGPSSLFQNLALGKASTDDKFHVAIPWVRTFNIKLSAKFYQNIPNGLSVKYQFFFFRIWTSAKPRPIPNVIWQFHGLHFVNTNVYANFHHNIPLSSRDRAVFIFFQNYELGKTSTEEKWHFAISWARSCQYQCLHNSLSKYSSQFKR